MSDRVIAEDGPERKRLQIRLTEYEGNRLLDLRFWYFSRADSEWRRTKKGIMLNRENFRCTREALNRHEHEILDWLGIGFVPEHVDEYNRRQENAAEATQVVGEVGHSTNPNDRSGMIFEAKHEGHRCEIVYNGSHPFAEQLESCRTGAEAQELLDELLAAYSLAKEELGDSPASNASILFDQLEHNWSQKLKRRLERQNARR